MNRNKDLIVSNLLAIIAGLCTSGLMILFFHKNPVAIYGLLFSSIFRDTYTIGEIFVKATPLIFSALAFAFTFKANLYNIGAEGQFYIGAVATTALSLLFPYAAAMPFIIVTSFLVSGLWSGAIGYAKAKYNANEFLVSMMSTYVALSIMNYLLRTVMMEAKGEYPQTETLSKSVWLPRIFAGSRLHYGFFLAVLTALFIWFLLYRTPTGFRIRAVGQNAEAARMSGIKPGSVIVISFFISGGLAGLAGVTEINGVQHMLLQGFDPDIGSLGIGIAILADANPVGIIFAAILFGALQVGGQIMGQLSNIPSSIINLMEGFVMIFVLIANRLRLLAEVRKEKRLLRRTTI
jgi:general nucleoside transport system permease protein